MSARSAYKVYCIADSENRLSELKWDAVKNVDDIVAAGKNTVCVDYRFACDNLRHDYMHMSLV